MLVQVAIGLQWVSMSAYSSHGHSSSPCDYETRDHVLALLYVLFLLAFASALALKSRRYRDNYRESRYIGASLACTAPAWATWVLAAAALPERHHGACVGFGLLSCCTITFAIMFLPKSRRLSAVGKEGIYLEDQQDDRFGEIHQCVEHLWILLLSYIK